VSHEILYTSASQGLKPGSRGFCTVVSTAGMAKNLAERLESFSGYRHAFMAHEAQAEQNPINYAHYHTTIGGRKYHILSRIADAGLDYTQRSNKLAHHVALEPSEIANAPGGPAWVMAAKGFFVEKWEGQVRTSPAGREPIGSDRPAQVCLRWKQLTGDAGWGGVLAESAHRKGALMSVIFPAGTPVLDLVVESLSLLPTEKRWDVTFSTYFTKAPAGVDCQWRFLLDGTPEATALRRDVRAAVIDLCRPLGQAQGGDLVSAARTSFVSLRASPPGAAPLQRSMPDSVRTATAALQPRDEEPQELALVPHSPPSCARRSNSPPAWLPAAKPVRRARWRFLAVAAGLVLLFLAVVVGAVLLSPSTVPPVTIVDSAPEANLPNEAPKAPDEAAPAGPSPPEEKSEESEGPKTEVDRPDAEPAMLQMPPAEEEKKDKPKPFEDIRRQQNKLPLPPLTVQDGQGSFARKTLNRNPEKLATLDVKDSLKCDLQLGGSEWEKPPDKQKNQIILVDKDGVRRWKIIATQPTILGSQDTWIGTFELNNGDLMFNWGGPPETKPELPLPPPIRLAFCSLKITVDDQDENCTFEVVPTTVPSVRFNDATSNSIGKATEHFLRPNDDLALELKVSGIKNPSFAGNKSRLTLKDRSTTLSVPVPSTHHPATDRETTVSVELSLDGDLTKSLCVSRPSALAFVLTGPKPQPGQSYWQTDKWEIRPAPIELTDQNIDNHKKMAQELVGKFKTWAVQKDRFPEIEKWTQLPQEQRTTAIEFAKPWSDYQRLVLARAADEVLKEKAHDLNNPDQSLLELYYEYRLGHTVTYAESYSFFDDFLVGVKAWCENVKTLNMNMQKDGRLDYRLYVKVDDREIDLVVTAGFRDAVPSADVPK